VVTDAGFQKNALYVTFLQSFCGIAGYDSQTDFVNYIEERNGYGNHADDRG
jgi:hypothetical protein